ncbi:DUF2304 domain-containing protein [Tahibacter harae]|uniref:Uncharacterized protein n=1 Tax=Tahibacter harae TaxID=2963937 RepID=A0ABT1QMY6_9GAMM|nr:DUF2304 domain-containing protein [Tahibacter harae]MCQ4163891.1 hypothetical protein [Tahibacter harae]
MDWKILGALLFGAVLGWNVYFVNRYRRGDISFGDIATLLGVVGGAAVLSLFPGNSDLFGAYGVGLGIGFFAYFFVLLGLVNASRNFDFDWFLDGRRKNPAEGYGYGTETRQTVAPMALDPTRPAAPPAAPGVTVNFHGSNPGEAALAASLVPPETLSLPSFADTRVRQVCADVWSKSGPGGPFREGSNRFVIEVAHHLGLSLSGTSDQILDSLERNPTWRRLPGAGAARDAALQGRFVIAGVKSDAGSPPALDGQLAVVSGGPLNAGGWAPAGYWGSSDPVVAAHGGGGFPLSECFGAELKDRIVYRCRDL